MRKFSITKHKDEEAATDREIPFNIPDTPITGDNLEAPRGQTGVYFRALIEHACDIISTFDAHGIRLYTSPSIERVLGYTSEEIVGQSGFDLLHPDDRKHFSKLFKQVVSTPGSRFCLIVR